MLNRSFVLPRPRCRRRRRGLLKCLFPRPEKRASCSAINKHTLAEYLPAKSSAGYASFYEPPAEDSQFAVETMQSTSETITTRGKRLCQLQRSTSLIILKSSSTKLAIYLLSQSSCPNNTFIGADPRTIQDMNLNQFTLEFSAAHVVDGAYD